jgi:protein TonB
MATASMASAPQMYKCSFPGCPVPVSIHFSLIETLQGIVHNEGGDQQGILYGQPSEVGTIVGSSHSLTVLGMEEMRRAMAEAYEYDPVVGYYRIREGNSLELTTDEINLAESLFAKRGSVILLVERRAGRPMANFFFVEHGKFMNFPLLEFPLDAATLTEREAQHARTIDEEAVVPYAPELLAPSSGSSFPPKAKDGKSDSGKRSAIRLSMFAIVIFVAIASFSAALLVFRPHNRIGNEDAAKSALPEARTSLRAERQGEDLKIMWDLNSPAVAGATSGVLDIDDGGTARRIVMTADQVRFGSVLYSPASEQISVRLTTLKDDQSTEQESVLVLLKRPPQPQSSNGQRSSHIPFQVKTERTASTRSLIRPTRNDGMKPRVEPKDPPTIHTSQERVDPPAPQPLASASSSPVITVPRSEPAKLASQASPGRIDPPAPQPLASASSPPVITAPRSAPAKPASQPSPERVDPPAPQPARSLSPPPATVVPRSAPATSREEVYVAPVLIAQQGVRTPRELLPILTRPVAVSVRVDINEAGRVTRAEAVAEKGIHAMLLSAATDAARRCRFQPARRGQTPVPSTITMVFHIGPAN